MSDGIEDPVCALLTQSLRVWRIAGGVERTRGGAILLRTEAGEIGIAPAPENLPFRWMVSVNGRKRGAISLVAVLRQVRSALDPGHAGSRVRVAVEPPVLS